MHVCKVEINNNKKEGMNNWRKELKEINEKNHEIARKNHKRQQYIYKTRKLYKEKKEAKWTPRKKLK